MIRILRILLFPISLIYGTITWLRNRLYDLGFISSTSFAFPVVVIGNLAVGGTGKSPMAEYILRLIRPEKEIMLLSRGYGRKTKGFREVSTSDTADLVGDEPLQIKRKFSNTQVFVCEDRVAALKKLSRSTQGILLDDAYQHRALQPSFSILLFDFNSLFNPILPLPTGNFRDNLRESRRAGVIVITKCPKYVSPEDMFLIESKFRKYTKAPLFYITIEYTALESPQKTQIDYSTLADHEVLLFTGIAKPEPLLEFLTPLTAKIKHIRFKDHHAFSTSDIQNIANTFQRIENSKKLLITTEKDFQRLPESFIQTHPLYILRIQQQVLFNQGPTFDAIIKRAFHIIA